MIRLFESNVSFTRCQHRYPELRIAQSVCAYETVKPPELP